MTPPLERGREADAPSAEPSEHCRDGRPGAPGDLADLLALADDERHLALPGLHQPEQVQQGARLDPPCGDGTRSQLATWTRGSATATSRRRYAFSWYFLAWWTVTVSSAATAALRTGSGSRASGALARSTIGATHGVADGAQRSSERVRAADLRGREVARCVGGGDGLREGRDEHLARTARRRCGGGATAAAVAASTWHRRC